MTPLKGVAVREALDSALVALQGARIENPRLDAEVLLAHALGVDRTALWLDPDREVTGDGARWFRDAIRQRTVQRVPVAYLVGHKGFRHLDLAVDPRVLVPRPETEHLVEALLELPHGARVHDVGTGSGAVALALKDERPDLVVSASDVSAGALAVARANAQRLELDVGFAQADLLEGIDGDLHAVVSNPPYVTEGDRAAMAPEVTAHEPHLALFAGAEGLNVIRPLVTQAAATQARMLALEVGAGQAPAVRGLVAAAGFPEVAVVRDLAGIERVVVGRR
ncbi:MAG TPA: peptide chain release factor N(5)-glutamine methyltransferase [Baekduia sp.]|uniref:peptide chain release factor N(5)-glutamine methyltransferase n=1 Tax=Baekduia sp. TaxID=2600305 RepID=UPI002C4BAB8B|nr:peptide chain release factor N(5)-glutamine methyltransferase [Baekduia sp.]HMJ32318.1 peptide chain release factor N(5)-glutamine methyltransferase [Baekduia sp.]